MSTFQIQSSAADLIARACQLTCITDIADPDIVEPLEKLLPSLNTEAQLSEAGAAAMEQHLLRILCNRLRMERDYWAHPEINEQKIARPLILVGGGRTGSTKLHQLLAASGDFKYLSFWQAHNPSLRSGDRGESPDERIRDSDEFVQWFNQRAPRAKTTHPYVTLETEEETHIYEMGSLGFLIFAFAFVPSFMMWYGAQDFRPQVAYFTRVLKYLQWQFYDEDARPWVIKYPGYQGFEDVMHEMFPDGTLVGTHRDPASTLSSSCSLFSTYYPAYSDANFDPFFGPIMLEGQYARLEQYMNTVRDNPDLNLLKLSYAELTKSENAVMEKVYAHARMPLGERARAAMLKWTGENALHKHGAHKYSLEQFGVTRAQTDARYARYTKEFGQYF